MSDAGRASRSGRGTAEQPRTWLGLRPNTLLMLVAIAVLLVPLSILAQPADSTSPGGHQIGRAHV